MTTLVTGGAFDVLHGNHRHFLNNLIELYSPTSIIILLNSDRKVMKKGYGRPMFSYQWRQEDLQTFINKNYPLLNVRFKEVKENSSSKDTYASYLGNSDYVIAMKSYFSFLKEDTNINTSNLVTFPEQKGQHTSTLPYLIENGEQLSECNTHKEGAVLSREGNIINMGMSGVKQSSVTKIGYLSSCNKCAPGRCSYLSAAEVALQQAVPNDDLFLSYPPDISAAKMIVSRMIRRVVYFHSNDITTGLEYLKIHNVQFRKAGVN